MEKYFNINESGVSIRCKVYYKDLKTAKRIVVYGHGFGGSKDNKAAEKFAEHVLKKFRDVAVITYDAPCHGNDVKKKLMLEDCGKYIKIVSDYAKKRFGTDEIYCFATSFGGYQFLKYIYENGNPFRKIALRCPAVNMYEVLSGTIMDSKDLKALAGGKSVLVGFDGKIKINAQFLDELKAADITELDYKPYSENIIITHGTKDEVVPFDVVKAFAQKNSIAFVPAENADHRFKNPEKMDFAIKTVIGFFGW